jgi:hypothetical protein
MLGSAGLGEREDASEGKQLAGLRYPFEQRSDLRTYFIAAMSRSAKSAARILLVLSAAICVYGQQTPTSRFEVAVVKPCVSDGEAGHRGARKGDGLESSPDRLHLPCQTLMSLIQWAWVNFAADHFNPLASVPIAGGPSWIQTGLFTIDAKAERPENWGTLNGPMLRALLEQRFKLRIHSETRDTRVYALTVRRAERSFRPRNALALLSTRNIRCFRYKRERRSRRCVGWGG